MTLPGAGGQRLPPLPARWEVSASDVVTETFSSVILRVTLAGGTTAIVKQLKPFDDVEDELRGAHYLRWRDGRGAVALLDVEGSAMLLEDAGKLHLGDVLAGKGDEVATEIAAGCMQELFAPGEMPPSPEFQPLQARFSSLFARAAKGADQDLAELYRVAAGQAELLLATQTDARPLHGDLHHDNILYGPRGWLAIDAKGLIGDPCFDGANFFFNPLARTDLCLDAGRITRMARIFSQRLGLDHARLLDFAFAWGALSACWHGEDGNVTEERRELEIASAILQVRQSATI